MLITFALANCPAGVPCDDTPGLVSSEFLPFFAIILILIVVWIVYHFWRKSKKLHKKL